MKLAIISPTSMLEDCSSQSEGVQLALAHLVLKDAKYAQWYRGRVEAGDLVILDNGAFEHGEPMPYKDIDAAQEICCAQVVVAPDFPGRPWNQTISALEDACARNPKYRLMGVPQSCIGDHVGYLRCFEAMHAFGDIVSHIGVSILGCPNAFCKLTNTKEPEINRVVATAYIRDLLHRKKEMSAFAKKLHYLGLGSHPEFVRLYDLASSLDTSSPVWHGMRGVSYSASGRLMNGKTHVPVEFDHPGLGPFDLRRSDVQANIDVLKRLAREAEGVK